MNALLACIVVLLSMATVVFYSVRYRLGYRRRDLLCLCGSSLLLLLSLLVLLAGLSPFILLSYLILAIIAREHIR